MTDSTDRPPGDSTGSLSTPGIDYPALVQDALRRLVRDVLGQVADLGLPGRHHFYISFATDYPGVGLGESLRARYPDEMTIVLQHDFRDLEVDDEGFDVTLRFGGIPQSVRVPFPALTAFFDPSVQFMLRFEAPDEEDSEEADAPGPTPVRRPTRIPTEALREADAASGRGAFGTPSSDDQDASDEDAAEGESDDQGESAGEKEEGESGRVVSIDAFRRK